MDEMMVKSHDEIQRHTHLLIAQSKAIVQQARVVIQRSQQQCESARALRTRLVQGLRVRVQ